MRKILIITYAFPPAPFVGVFRTLKYCKYLPEFGWRPIVIAPKVDLKRFFYDNSLLKQIHPEVKVYLTRDIDPAKWLINNDQGFVLKMLAKIKNVLCKYICIPDSHVFWTPICLFRAIKIIRSEGVDLLYSTSPPHSSHLVPYILHKIFAIKYVVDFRDPWADKAYFKFNKRNRLFSWFEKKLRDIVIRNSSKIITITNGECRELAEQFPENIRDKITFIENGYDPDDFHSITKTIKKIKDKFTITYTGTLYDGTADEFFEGIKIFLEEHDDFCNNLRIILIGGIGPAARKKISDLGLDNIVTCLKFQPHEVALQYMLNSDLLLILLGGDLFPSSEIPAKTFEYLYALKPILAITKHGDLSDLLIKSGLGVVVRPNDPTLVAQAISDILDANNNSTLKFTPNIEFINKYERRNLSKRLVSHLNKL